MVFMLHADTLLCPPNTRPMNEGQGTTPQLSPLCVCVCVCVCVGSLGDAGCFTGNVVSVLASWVAVTLDQAAKAADTGFSRF